MGKSKVQTWSKEEIELLKENWDIDISVLEGLFPTRSKKSIKHKITRL
jgi:hypothetical protein